LKFPKVLLIGCDDVLKFSSKYTLYKLTLKTHSTYKAIKVGHAQFDFFIR